MKGRVLIIDDEAEIRRNLSVGLTQEGFTVVACPDGISAIHELNRAGAEGRGFDYLVTDIFMPDIDGLKILRVIKSMFPDLPVLVITGFGDEKLKCTALAEFNTAYLDKPFEIPDLVKALDGLTPGSGTKGVSAAEAEEPVRESVSAYLTIRIRDTERSMDIFDELYNMNGVQQCDAVFGDVDVILLAQASSMDGVEDFFGRVQQIDGLEVVSMSAVERPRLDPDVDRFIDIYQHQVKDDARSDAPKHAGTTSYVIVDIEKNAIQRVFTTVFFIDEVVFCDVIDGGNKLVGMVTGLDAGGQVRKVVERLSQIDGVLRVREAKVIKMIDN